MKIGILTSSRADFGVYQPLVKKLFLDKFFEPKIIMFGTHLSPNHGFTKKNILDLGFPIAYEIETVSNGDSPNEIALSMSKTISGFSELWKNNTFDLVFAMGDRYEMFSAVASTVPFNIKVAHFHGGETTLGAIDNIFRHCISLMSTYHFTACQQYFERVCQIINDRSNVYNVGALSFDAIDEMKFLSIEEFQLRFHVDLSIPTILVTFHPETVSYKKNEAYATELVTALKKLKHYQVLITMPNADTMGSTIRKELNKLISESNNVFGFENLGSQSYLSCMKHCAFMLGNTSSGFIEASYFPKYVINLGKRQEGRMITSNILSCEINAEEIIKKVKLIEKSGPPPSSQVYGKGNVADKIIEILKKHG